MTFRNIFFYFSFGLMILLTLGIIVFSSGETYLKASLLDSTNSSIRQDFIHFDTNLDVYFVKSKRKPKVRVKKIEISSTKENIEFS